ncbi:MAG: hypothetical protein KBA14_00970 [Saprospiraceae bacterium]|nr:hypothetical protein [Saprospiraceae bacterium]
MKKLSVETIAFGVVLFLGLLPVLFCDYIVTGDGPCHLYNSKIFLSWVFEGQKEFFKPFYQLNQFIEPNWITNAIQIPLLKWFPVIWTEKLFFGFYILVFSFGFRKVIAAINPESVFLACIGVLFAWNMVLMKGFTNNAWSIALWFWILAYWIKAIPNPSAFASFRMAMLLFLQYLSHPMGFFISLFSIGCVVLIVGWYDLREKGAVTVLRFYLDQIWRLLVSIIAPVILFLQFFLRRDWNAEAQHVSKLDLWNDLLHLKALITLSNQERIILLLLSIMILYLFSLTLFQRIRKKAFVRYDGFMLLFLSVLSLFIFPPTSFSGGLEIGIRLGIFPFLCLLFWIATNDFSARIRNGVSIAAVLFALILTMIRLPIQVKASSYASEIVTCADHIQDTSTLLVLNYDWAGKTPDGKVIADAIWLFPHVDCYLGAYKNLVISDNYETNFWYFPMVERWETNMYSQTDKDGINFDHRPPRADINNYKGRTGQYLDYVLMLSYSTEFEAHPYTQEIFTQLDAEYEKVFTSEHARAILYRRTKY